LGTLDHLNTLITTLQGHAVIIAISVAELMAAIYAIYIMLDSDSSPAARQESWKQLKKVFICAAIVVAIPAGITLIRGLVGML
jgi:uncharacterized membrane protein